MMMRWIRYAFKGLLGLLALMVLAIVGLDITIKLTSRPIGSPPPGYEDRLKYDWSGVMGPPHVNDTKVDLWFGKRDKIYDTTHFRILHHYLGNTPQYHGEYVDFNLVWPSLRSNTEESQLRKKNGLPPVIGKDQWLSMSIFEGTPYDSYRIRCSPIVRDEVRGVQYCNKPMVPCGPKNASACKTRQTHYWPIDERIKTPNLKTPFHMQCGVTPRDDGSLHELCSGEFSYNQDSQIFIGFVSEAVAVEIVANFPKLLQFIQSLEIKP